MTKRSKGAGVVERASMVMMESEEKYLNGAGQGVDKMSYLAKSLFRAGLLSPLSPQDKKDRDLGRAVRGMGKGTLLRRNPVGWFELWKIVGNREEFVRSGPTPEAALKASRKLGNKRKVGK